MAETEIDKIVRNIEERRKKRGWSVDKLSKEAQISFSTLTKIRQKEVADVRVSTLKAIAQALGCSMDELVE
jgi:DNA-binding Xre family transcriptional regulator